MVPTTFLFLRMLCNGILALNPNAKTRCVVVMIVLWFVRVLASCVLHVGVYRTSRALYAKRNERGTRCNSVGVADHASVSILKRKLAASSELKAILIWIAFAGSRYGMGASQHYSFCFCRFTQRPLPFCPESRSDLHLFKTSVAIKWHRREIRFNSTT